MTTAGDTPTTWLVFRVGPVACAVSAVAVDHIDLPPARVTGLPGATDADPGLIPSGREIAAVVDMHRRFGLPAPAGGGGRLLSTHLHGIAYGFRVDEVVGLVPSAAAPLPPDLPGAAFTGVLLHGKELVLISDFARLRAMRPEPGLALAYRRLKGEEPARPAGEAEAGVAGAPREGRPDAAATSPAAALERGARGAPRTAASVPADRAPPTAPQRPAPQPKPSTVTGVDHRPAAGEGRRAPSVAPVAPVTRPSPAAPAGGRRASTDIMRTRPATSALPEARPLAGAATHREWIAAERHRITDDAPPSRAMASHPPGADRGRPEAREDATRVAPAQTASAEAVSGSAGGWWVGVLLAGFAAVSAAYLLWPDAPVQRPPAFQSAPPAHDAPSGWPAAAAVTPAAPIVPAGASAAAPPDIPGAVATADTAAPAGEPLATVEPGTDGVRIVVAREAMRADIAVIDAPVEASATPVAAIAPAETHAVAMEPAHVPDAPVAGDGAAVAATVRPDPTEPARSAAPADSCTRRGNQCVVTHVVVRGDTLWAIAARYIDNPWRYPELAALSDVSDPNRIYPGQHIYIVFQ